MTVVECSECELNEGPFHYYNKSGETKLICDYCYHNYIVEPDFDLIDMKIAEEALANQTEVDKKTWIANLAESSSRLRD